MSTIDRISQDAARSYVQNTDAARTGGAQVNASVPDKATSNVGSPQADSVTLSEGARALAAARQTVQDAPDVREDKVADIKQQVSDGTYTVAAWLLARKMLEASNTPSS